MNLMIRASSLGEIMATAKKAGELSAGARTFIRKEFKRQLFGYDDRVSSKYLEKGTMVETESIALYNEVTFGDLIKNLERKTEGNLTGECDLIDGNKIIDIKSSWSLATFPIWPDEAENSGYEWQLRAYMYLWDAPRAELAYCMVDTPEHLIGYEDRSLHIVSHIPAEMRVTVLRFERDAEKEQAMLERIKLAQAYFQQLQDDYFGAGHADVCAA